MGGSAARAAALELPFGYPGRTSACAPLACFALTESLVVAFLILFHLAEFASYHLVWKRTAFALTETAIKKGETRDDARWGLARITPGTIMWAWLAPYSMYHGLRLALATDEPVIVVPDHQAGNEVACVGCEASCYGGCVFSAFNFYQFGKLLRGVDSGVAAWVHHTVFLMATVICPAYFVGPELVLLALGMELSTPFLNVQHVFRTIKVHQGLEFLVLLLFSSTFVFSRNGVFGYALARAWGGLDLAWLWGGEDDAQMTATRKQMYCVLFGVFFIGWSLSVYWSCVVAAKVRRAVARGGVGALAKWWGGGHGANGALRGKGD